MRIAARTLWAVAFVAGCATPSTIAVLSMQDLACASCGAGVVAAVEGVEGVTEATFDAPKAELRVEYDAARVEVASLLKAVEAEGQKVVPGEGKGSYVAGPEFSRALDVVWINKAGADVDPLEHLVAGKFTVVDFFAEWCGPCKDVDRALIDIMKARPDVAVRKIDVLEWDSPVAKARLAKVSALPYTLVFDPDGRRVDAIAGKDLPRLSAALQPPAAP